MSSNKAECYVDEDKRRYAFFAGEVQGNLKVGLYDPYQNVDEIVATVKNVSMYKSKVESTWRIPNRCLDRFDIDGIVQFEGGASGIAARGLVDNGIISSGPGDFICYVPDGRLMIYRPSGSNDSASIALMYPIPAVRRLLDLIYLSNERRRDAQVAMNKQILPVREAQLSDAVAQEKISCADLKYGEVQDSEKYHENLIRLAKLAKLEGGVVNRYHEEVVSGLCGNDTKTAAEAVASAYVTKSDADSIATALGLSTIFPEPKQDALDAMQVRERLRELGLSNSASGNISEYVRQHPTYECSTLVQAALTADAQALEALEATSTCRPFGH